MVCTSSISLFFFIYTIILFALFFPERIQLHSHFNFLSKKTTTNNSFLLQFSFISQFFLLFSFFLFNFRRNFGKIATKCILIYSNAEFNVFFKKKRKEIRTNLANFVLKFQSLYLTLGISYTKKNYIKLFAMNLPIEYGFFYQLTGLVSKKRISNSKGKKSYQIRFFFSSSNK